MMRSLFLLFVTALSGISVSRAQVLNFHADVMSDAGDSCGRKVEITLGGSFQLPITYFNRFAIGGALSTTSSYINYCKESDIFGWDANCYSFTFDPDDYTPGEPHLYISDVIFDLGGPSNCDNNFSITVKGLEGAGMHLRISDLGPSGGDYINAYVADSTYTMTGFCMDDFGGTNRHTLSVTAYTPSLSRFALFDISTRPNTTYDSEVGMCEGNINIGLDIVPATDMTTCNGAVTSGIVGGTPPYTYSYSNGSAAASQTSMCPGMYSLSVEDADGLNGFASFIIPDSANIYYDNPLQIPVDTLMAGALMNCDIDYDSPLDTIYIDTIIHLTSQLIKVTYIIEQDTNVFEWSETYYTDTSGYFCFMTNVFCEEVTRASSGIITAYLFGEPSETAGVYNPAMIKKDFKIYPVPFNHEFTVEFGGIEKEGAASIMVYDRTGRRVMEETRQLNRGINRLIMNGSTLSKGVYFVEVVSAGKKMIIGKMVK